MNEMVTQQYLILARNVLKVGVMPIDRKASAWSLDDCWVCFFNIFIAETSKIERVKVMTISIGQGAWLWVETSVWILCAGEVLGREPEYFVMNQLQKHAVITVHMTHCLTLRFDAPA